MISGNARRWSAHIGRIVVIVCAVIAGNMTDLPAQTQPARLTHVRVDASAALPGRQPIWRFFGADEPNYATMPDGRRLIGELGKLGTETVYFRTHNLLCTGDGTPALKWGSTNAYTEDAAGKPVYDWTILDRIFDTYHARGVKPYAQIGFMPKALSTHPEPYQHAWRPGVKYDQIATGWAYPPNDYNKWAELVFQWVRHCVERYGKAEVEQWYWQVWNEPNLSFYWRGTPEEFLKLHDYAIDAVRRALPTARVGGCDVAGSGGAFFDSFLRHVTSETNFATGKVGTPTDFLSFHAKGSPKFIDNHVRMGIATQLKTIDTAFATIARHDVLRDRPIVIGESDPDGCAACQGPQLGYRNGTMYSSYTAASFARKWQLAEKHRVNLAGALTWAFEFENQPYFAGFRVLSTNGIDLPVLNVFRQLSMMRGTQVATSSDGEVALPTVLEHGVTAAADVSAIASINDGRAYVLLWHYHDDDLPGPDAEVELTIEHLPQTSGEMRVTEWPVDDAHANAFSAWQKMGSPQHVSPERRRELQSAAELRAVAPPRTVEANNGRVVISQILPRRAVTLLVIEPAR
jgi:xylan 1,4-beta-xylosidase